MITLRSTNVDLLRLDAMRKRNVIRQIRFALHQIGIRHKRSADNAILGRTEIKRGRLYRIPGRRRPHRASAPGQSHANLTGRLRRSIGWRVRSSRQMLFGYGADGKDTPFYAPFLEFGTSRMEPRPSLLNALTAERRNTIRELDRHARRVLITRQ